MERCPILPSLSEKIHWPFDDPSSMKRSDEEIMTGVRRVRDQIKEAILAFNKERS